MNPLGVISMVYARPFTAEHLPLFGRIKAAGLDFVELLVPEPGELPSPRRGPRWRMLASVSSSPPA